jgi:polysaccharide pyruvyl transferase WcaK-like protein
MTHSHVPSFPEYPNVSINGQHVTLFKVNKDLRATISWLIFLLNAKKVYLIGADSIDEYYSPSDSRAKMYAAQVAGLMGIDTNVMSFSINEVTDGLKKRMVALPDNVHLIARDPVSFERLQEQQIPRIHCSSDLSFLFKPSKVRDDKKLLAYLEKNPNKLIGFSFNNLLFSDSEDNTARFDFYAEAIYGLIQKSNMSVIFIPNNVKDSTKYSGEIHNRIDKKLKDVSYLTEYLGDCAELKALMSKCHYYFSTTLHMGLFPLGVGVPTTVFPYAGKFDGPLSYLNIPDSLIEVADIPADPDEFAELLYSHVLKAVERKKKIEENIERVINLAKINLADFNQ